MTLDREIAVDECRALLESAAAFVELTVAREEMQARVVLLARRLTQDWKLTDEEAVSAAGALAVRALLARRGGGDGR